MRIHGLLAILYRLIKNFQSAIRKRGLKALLGDIQVTASSPRGEENIIRSTDRDK